MQSFLSIFSLVLITILAVMLYSWVGRSTDQGYYVDTVQEIRAINIDFFDFLATLPFDARTVNEDDPTYVTPYNPSELTPAANFGGGGCTPYVTCVDLDDYHGKTIVRNLSWFDITTRIEVVYVSVDNPNVETGTQSYAKEVRVYASSPFLTKVNANLSEIRMARTYTYFHQQAPP